jgi:hypothetical protein
MNTSKVNLCGNCEMSAYAPLGTQKAVILRNCYTCTQLHVHTHVWMCVCVCVCVLLKVSILLGCGAASLGDWCSKFCNNVGVSSSKQSKKNASFLQFMAPEAKITMLSQNIRDQSPSYVVPHPLKA